MITPSQFYFHRNEYQITVDTSKLLAEENYERQIILRANYTSKINYSFTIKVQTAPIVFQHTNNPLIKFFNRWISPQLEEEKITLALTHSGTPNWSDKDFQNLLQTLGSAGYGWLKPEGINQQLQDMMKRRW
ncbi:MAG: hypothetical protein F6K54_39765 [Okeania sp. SIO3B5]|uniref:hypothetical protein n=1 Tax=Okeania sp. SIO3B5 TaxID=2607811 RepID=UPI0013FEB015|nr:hypothetical protein [Okeania sp. SIO3B5]NEO58649.1 hypothetical protein [Okeania sp. SIO3B5]